MSQERPLFNYLPVDPSWVALDMTLMERLQRDHVRQREFFKARMQQIRPVRRIIILETPNVRQ